jgi:hypothetical protein
MSASGAELGSRVNAQSPMPPSDLVFLRDHVVFRRALNQVLPGECCLDLRSGCSGRGFGTGKGTFGICRGFGFFATLGTASLRGVLTFIFWSEMQNTYSMWHGRKSCIGIHQLGISERYRGTGGRIGPTQIGTSRWMFGTGRGTFGTFGTGRRTFGTGRGTFETFGTSRWRGKSFNGS